jgi:hypothetical protein
MSIIVNDFPKNAEYWRTVDGFPAYEISTDGRVRTIKTGKIRKLQVLPIKGYIQVGLQKDKKDSKHYVHILVATAFCNRDEGCNIVDHIDQNPANNNYQNIRWTTYSINNRNKSIRKDNSSGITGVHYNTKTNRWIATWYNINMKSKTKYFSIKKYGDQAKQMAIDLRRQMAEENGYLNV